MTIPYSPGPPQFEVFLCRFPSKAFAVVSCSVMYTVCFRYLTKLKLPFI